MNFWAQILNLLFPAHCPGCACAIKNAGEWCGLCLQKVWEPRLINGSSNKNIDGCYTLGSYQGILRQVLIDLKFKKQLKHVKQIEFLLDQFRWWDRLESQNLVVPIPLSNNRFKARGFDQTDEIFRNYISENSKIWCPALYRVIDTKPQSQLPRRARVTNIKGSFAIKESFCLKNKKILLVDDIYTTGSTMKEAARVLKRAGADSIWGVVIASGAS